MYCGIEVMLSTCCTVNYNVIDEELELKYLSLLEIVFFCLLVYLDV